MFGIGCHDAGAYSWRWNLFSIGHTNRSSEYANDNLRSLMCREPTSFNSFKVLGRVQHWNVFSWFLLGYNDGMGLGLHVVRYEVDGGMGGDSACWPIGIIGEVGREQRDTKFTLNGDKCALNRTLNRIFHKIQQTMIMYAQ